MRTATSQKVSPGSATAQPFFFPAPLGGMNTRDPPALVPINEASYLQDCYPTTSGIKRRLSWARHVTGMPAQTRTLMLYTTSSGTETLFAAAGTDFYNVTSFGAVGAAVVSGLTNATWEFVNYSLSSGAAYLCCFNGTDSPRYWDNATWTTVTGISAPAITGLTTSTIASSFVHQRRMWLVQVNSLKVWYLPPDSVGGAALAFDLGGIATEGGYVLEGLAWTIDGADGPDDYWLVVTSSGQMIVFQGTDPSSASSWALVGTSNIATPIGRRCLYKHKGDVLIITDAGVASAIQVMRGNTSTTSMITDKIRGSYSLSYTTNGGRLLWQLMYHPKTDLIYLLTDGGASYPLNSSTGAWGGGHSLNARCAAIFNGELYYAPMNDDGTAGTQIRKLSGAVDASDETSVTMYLNTPYNDFGIPAVIKSLSLARIAGTTGADPDAYLDADVDYGAGVASTTATISRFDGLSQWLPVLNVGVSVALRLKMTTLASSTNNIYGFYVLYQTGGLVGASALT